MVGFQALIDGRLWIIQQVAPGAPLGDEIDSGVDLDDVGFRLAPAMEGAGEWLLVGVKGGEVKHWRSADDGEHWEGPL